MTASGKVKSGQAGKRHGMIKRSNKFLRNARGTTTLSAADATIVKKYMPYARCLNWGLGAALGAILLVVVLALYWLYDKFVGIDNVKLG